MSPRRGGRAPATTTPEQILAGFPPEVRALAARLRALVTDAVPGAAEVAYPGWRAIGYRDPQAGYFCGLFSHSRGVNVAFEHGVSLPDPAGLLSGDGRQVRYLRLAVGDAIPDAPLRELLEAALRFGSVK